MPATTLSPVETVETDTIVEPELPYSLILWNDPINSTGLVTLALLKVLQMDRVKAEAVMWEAHTNGKAAAAAGEQEQVHAWATALHTFGLNATVETTK